MSAAIVPATLEHVAVIAAKARTEDVAELWAQARQTPEQAMHNGLRWSIVAFTGLIDDVPVAMFGVTPYSILSGHGVPWLVGSTDLQSLRAQKELLRRSREGLDLLASRFTFLFNMVDDRNHAAKRWLGWLGFTLLEPSAYGPDRVPFRPFYRGIP